MKRLFSFFILFLFLIRISAQIVIEPDFEFEPFVLNVQDSTLGEPLPCETASVRSKPNKSAMFWGIGKILKHCYVKSLNSTLQLDSTQTIIINTGGKSPRQTISINKFDQTQKERSFKIGEIKTINSEITDTEDGVQNYQYKKYGEQSVIIPLSSFKEGEYCISITNSMDNSKSVRIYTFGIKKEK